MDYSLLPTLVFEVCRPLVDFEEHHRAGTKVEWDKISHEGSGIARHPDLLQPPPLDVVEANHLRNDLSGLNSAVGEQLLGGYDLRQVATVGDVVDRRHGGPNCVNLPLHLLFLGKRGKTFHYRMKLRHWCPNVH